MPPKKGTKGKPKARPASPIAGPSSAKKSRKVAASFLDSDSDEFTDDAKSVAMSDVSRSVRSDPIERPEPVAAVDTVIPDEDEDAPLARTTKRSTLRPSTAEASAAAAVVRDDDDVDDPQPQPLPMDSDDETSVVVDPREVEPTPSTSR